jgi:hypothetical protein
MSSIYGRLGFNSNDPTTNNTVSQYSSSVQTQMKLMPPLLNSWQTADVANNNVGGYFTNPVGTVTQNITDLANTIFVTGSPPICNGSSLPGATGTYVSAIINDIASKAGTIGYSTGPNYLYITNRQSNVVDIGTDTTTPHYKTATGIGKLMSYLVSASDGIQNTSPIMGSFTSITLGNTLNSLYSTLNTYSAIFISSIDSGSNTSNISAANANALSNTVNSIASLFYTYPAQDTAFFTNSQSVLNDFTSIRQFSNLGQTETYLLNNYIGTPKIKSRINS